MATFTITPDFGASRTTKPRVNSAKFGDGYEQRVPFGINTVVEEWTLRFANRTNAEKTELLDFLSARAGVESFDWTPVGDTVSKKFVCREWSDTLENNDLYSITAKFEQVFEP